MSITLDSDFPGGNTILERIDGDDVYLHQDLRDTDCDWFYWCFDVRGAQGRTLTFHFTQSRALGTRGPGISRDGGWSWQWLGADCVDDNSFRYRFSNDETCVRLSFAMQYTRRHWDALVARLADCPHLSQRTLCRTRAGREVPYALLGCLDGQPQHRAAIMCRHHCCEMVASYELEGLVEWTATSPDPLAQWLRTNVQMFIVPMVDIDGVEQGDQGKARRPRDHNRDYEGESIYAATAAIREQLPLWGGDRLRLALDLHDPWICGNNNEHIYMVGSRDEQIAAQQQRFTEHLVAHRQSPLPLEQPPLLPFGTAWNFGQNESEGKAFSRWVGELASVRMAGTVELPYASVGNVEVTPNAAREFGQDVARAIAAYLGECE